MKKSALLFTLSPLLLATAPAAYNGAPFSQVTRSSATDLNFLPGIFAAQIEDEALQLTVASADLTQFLFAVDDGGTAIKLLESTTTPVGGAGPFTKLGLNFQRKGADSATTDLVVEASIGSQSGYYRYDGANWNQLLTTGTTMPGTTQTFDRLGEPHTSGNKTAFLGISNDTSGSPDFRGVYLHNGGTITKLVDANDTLPGLGTFGGSSSQVGFDGSLVAFWAIFSTDPNPPSGIFSVTTSGTVTKLSLSGETVPTTTTTIKSYVSPPAVDNGTTYFAATDDAFNRYLMKSDGGAPTLIAKNGDILSTGGVLGNICSYPPLASGGKVVFDAKVDGLPAILEFDGSALTIAAVSTDLPQFTFSPPSSMVPFDFEGDLLAIRATSGATSYLYLNQSEPAVPTLVSPRTETFLIEDGGDITLNPQFVGQGPLTFSWNNGLATTQQLTLTNLDAATLGQGRYTLRIQNDNGSVFYTATVILNVAPYFPFDLTDKSYFENQTISLSLSSPGGAQPFTYQWFKNGDPLPTQTNATLSIPNATSADTADYYVEVTNSKGTTQSATSTVTVNPIPSNQTFAGATFNKLIDDPSFFTTRSLNDLSFFINPVTGLTSLTDLDFSLNGTRIIEIDADGKSTNLLTKADMETATGLSIISIELEGYFSNGDALIHSKVAPNFTRAVLHRMTSTGFELLVDTASLPVTTATPITPVYFFTSTVENDQVLAVAPDIDGRAVTILIENGTPTLLVDTAVPITDGQTSSVKLSYSQKLRLHDGIMINEVDEAFSFQRAWKVPYSGTPSIIMEKDFTLDGEAKTTAVANFLGEADDWFYFTTSFGTVRTQGGTVEKFAPKLPMGTSGSLNISIIEGQLFAISRSETSTGNAVYRFRNEAFEVVHDGEFLDMLPLRSQDLMIRSVRGNEVLLSGTESFNAPIFLFINAGADPLTNTVEPFVFTATGLTITIPEDQFLYRSTDLQNWTKVEATGTYPVTYNGAEYFQFRTQ
ncbi:MAG: immunoglobulin domain-containing protein [Verrucomicrobiaceae bacterium]